MPDDSQLQIGETPLTRRILAHLDALGLPYERLEHEPVTTSEAAARARASPLREGANLPAGSALDMPPLPLLYYRQ